MQAEQKRRFEEWKKLENPKYQPTDDSMQDRRDWKVWSAALDPTIQKSLIVADQFDAPVKMVAQLRKLQAVAKSIERAHKALDNRKPPTVKQAAKDGADRRAIKQQIDREMHELHCLAVEIGIADADPARYGEKRIAAGFGRDHLEMRRAPEDFKLVPRAVTKEQQAAALAGAAQDPSAKTFKDQRALAFDYTRGYRLLVDAAPQTPESQP